ncbi:MAG: Gfo/Idh/MocA family oxidoreductase [Pirellulaceae bacterium]|nr:Gfo/Idh/MocA family oxidoreductase [Pirellulaceae bacterium]
MDRRNFLRTGSAAIALTGVKNTIGKEKRETPISKKRVCLIGCGWYGKVDLFRLLQVEENIEVVSLCDVDSKMLAECAELTAARQKSGNTPKTYTDYRKLLSDGGVDIALIATPDHWHALPMIEACQKGLDVYVQKPIGVDVIEGQAMLAAARKHNNVVQVGMQRRSTPHLIEAKQKIIDTGLLGDIGLAEVYCYYHMRARQNPKDSQPPEHFNYDMWTGPAPMRPYNFLVHPRRWRAFMEYSNGIMGDMCVHMLDTVRWMLDLRWPSRIASTGGILVETESKANTADTQSASFEFDDLRVQWQHRSYGHPPDPEYPWGATLYGSKGTLRLSVHKWHFKPIDKKAREQKQDVVYELEQYPEDKTEADLEKHVAPAVRGHMRDFLKCIETRDRPVSDIEEGHISATSCILANIAMKLGRTLEWDPKTHTVVGDAEATRLLARTYRKPWIHPDPNNV